MPLRPWLRRTLWGAFFLSLLLHVLGAFSEELYAWLTRPEFEQTALKKTERQLKSLTLDEDAANAALAGIKKPDELVVYLRKKPLPHIVKKPLPKPALPRAAAVASATAVAAPVIVAQAASSVVASKPVAVVASPVQVASAPATQASQPESLALERFPSELKITYIYGIIPATMYWKVANGRYDLQLDGGFLGISRKFISSGKADKRGVTPDSFIEYRNHKPDPFYQVDFDWKNLTAEVGEPGKRKVEPIAAGDQDIFSSAFHIGLIGGSKPEYTFSIFSGRRKYESVRLKVAGEAKLRLGEREVDALLLRGEWDDRQVDFWLAPEWHNIPVRITIVLGKELSLDIWANEITMEGKKVLEWVKPKNKAPGERGNK